MAEDFPSLHDDLGDRYAIERELGHGATATVYLARDRKNADRLVAAANLTDADSALSRLADQLLFEDSVVSANGGDASTRSVIARNAFARGLSSVHAWELVAADSEFRRAADDDPRFAQAHLWLGGS